MVVLIRHWRPRSIAKNCKSGNIKSSKRMLKKKETEVVKAVQLIDRDSNHDENSIGKTIWSLLDHQGRNPIIVQLILEHQSLFHLTFIPKLVSLVTRMKLSPAEQAVYAKAIIEESGGDHNKVAVSYPTAKRKSKRRLM
ncbi:unnamed protein product [Lepeophtheirus salmonis]|uniref:(salmon louse) hypothetical protein n=1 Tax=Lepeophtheirus salmonis TaxID=72036 RepID=A0A7R8H7Z1_LEPSM|nr:unnamed protein product [Lepeophtheirus salmonis]CAF2929800.1 unnamed protein product [Lepeophtheirus salmonis]